MCDARRPSYSYSIKLSQLDGSRSNLTIRAEVTRQKNDDGVALGVLEGRGWKTRDQRERRLVAASCRRIAAVALWGFIEGSKRGRISDSARKSIGANDYTIHHTKVENSTRIW